MDKMASRTFISAGLIAQLGIKPDHQERISLQTIDDAVEREVDIFPITLHSLANKCQLTVKAACLHSNLYITHIPNPQIRKLKELHPEFKELYFSTT